MIRKVLHKTFSAILAFLVLLSTVSFTVEKHFCGDVLVDVSMFSQVEKCGMEMPVADNCQITKKSCCKDEVDVVQGQKELKPTSFDDLHFQKQVLVVSFLHSFLNLFHALPEQIASHKYYSPPNIVSDIHVLNEVFII